MSVQTCWHCLAVISCWCGRRVGVLENLGMAEWTPYIVGMVGNLITKLSRFTSSAVRAVHPASLSMHEQWRVSQ